jgi:CheY-like chemotaxis protein
MTTTQTVLIVDDDPEWRDFVAGTLSERYPVRFASSGEDGLRLARETLPSIIVLDVMMPGGMDGFRVLCELRKEEATQDIPVIMLTSVNIITDSVYDTEVLGQFLGKAPSAFLDKPVSPALLLAEVERVLAAESPPLTDS